MATESANPELESFRRQWLYEVSGRAKTGPRSVEVVGAAECTSSSTLTKGKTVLTNPDLAQKPPKPPPLAPEPAKEQASDPTGDDPKSPLTSERTDRRNVEVTQTPPREPRSALEHYETGVEKEAQGRLGDSLKHYRQAYKLDSDVDKSYRKKYFPAASSSARPTNADGVSKAAKASSQVRKRTTSSAAGPPLRRSVPDLIRSFSTLTTIPAAAATIIAGPENDDAASAAEDAAATLPCPIATLPVEVLIEVLFQAALIDMGVLGRLAQVCRRLAYLVAVEERIWQRLCCGSEVGFGGMHYSWACEAVGRRLVEHQSKRADPNDRRHSALAPPTYLSIPLTPKYPTYMSNLRRRPRIRFNGCYISTVNYIRSGATASMQASWNSPVFIVTYYRYLRFFRDGTVISLVSNHEPSEVVYHLKKENLPFRSLDSGHTAGAGAGTPSGAGSNTHNPSSLPTSILHHAAFGRWRLGTCPVLSSLPARPASSSSAPCSSSTASAASASASATGYPSSSSSVPSARTAHELEHGCTRDSKGPEYENWQEKGRSGAEDDEDSIFLESEGLNTTYLFAMHLSVKSLSSSSTSTLSGVRSGGMGANVGGGGGGGGSTNAAGGSGRGGGGVIGGGGAGGATRNNKLVIKSYWSYNRPLDMWNQFTTTDDTPFFWSRVKSYGSG